MIIAQISDTHIDFQGPQGAARIRYLEACVDAINRLDPLPDVVLHTGDMTQTGAPAEYREVARIVGRLRCPFYVTPGNRDDRDALRAAFPVDNYLQPDLPFIQYSVDTFPVRLIALDTKSANGNMGDFCYARADSLQAALAYEAHKPTLVFMHHPPFEITASKYPFQFESQDTVARMSQVLNRHGQVVRAFCGHAHRDAVGTIGDVPVSTMPSVAVDLRLGDFPDTLENTPLFQIHTFDEARGVTSETRAARDYSAVAAQT